MKKNLFTSLTAGTLLLGIALSATQQVSATTTLDCSEDQTSTLGSQAFGQSDVEKGYSADRGSMNLSSDTQLSLDGYDISTSELEEMLTVLINDEYKARAEYVAISDEFGVQEPFTSLIVAETSHADALANLFDKYGLDVPEDTGEDYVVMPDSLQEAYEIGVQAEIANAQLYEDYLSQDLPANVEQVLTNLMDASLDNHLITFEAYASGDLSELDLQKTNELTQFNQNIDRGNGRR